MQTVSSDVVVVPKDLISADLISASYRSDDFPKEMSPERRAEACTRYAMWLNLKRLNPKSRLAPTREIDLFWHLHMLSPVAYYNDCIRTFGKIIDHDGGFGKGEGELPLLQRVFTKTAELWQSTYGVPYRDDGKWMHEQGMTNCWHDCQGRCWHDCKEN